MSRIIGAASARFRLALGLVVGAAVAVLMPSVALTIDAPSAAALVAVAVALAAVGALWSRVVMPAPGVVALRPRLSQGPPADLAGHVTDPGHHPVRPRAPGLV